MLPGTTFADPAERGNYQSAEQACVYLSAVDKLLNIFLADIYAERFHPARWNSGAVLGGKDPAWLCPGAATQRGRVDDPAGVHHYPRPVQHYGIEFAFCAITATTWPRSRTQLRGQPAKVKFIRPT